MVERGQRRDDAKARARRLFAAAIGGGELSWTYILAFQVFLIVTFRPVMELVQTGTGRVAGFVVMGIGEAWLAFHVMRKLHTHWKHVPRG